MKLSFLLLWFVIMALVSPGQAPYDYQLSYSSNEEMFSYLSLVERIEEIDFYKVELINSIPADSLLLPAYFAGELELEKIILNFVVESEKKFAYQELLSSKLSDKKTKESFCPTIKGAYLLEDGTFLIFFIQKNERDKNTLVSFYRLTEAEKGLPFGFIIKKEPILSARLDETDVQVISYRSLSEVKEIFTAK